VNLRFRIFFHTLRALVLGGVLVFWAKTLLTDWEFRYKANDILAAALAGGLLFLAVGILERTAAAPYELEFRRYFLRVLALASRRGGGFGHALLALADDLSGPGRRAVFTVLSRLDEGVTLGSALEAAGRRYVPLHVVEAVRAAERTGRVPEALEACATECVGEHSRRVQGLLALLYPLAMVLQFLFVTTTIVPQFGTIFGQIMDKDGNPLLLPGATLWTLRIGDFTTTALLYAFLGLLPLLPFLAPLLFAGYRRRAAALLAPVLLRVPVLGYHRLLRAGERTCRHLAGAAAAGVPLPEALLQAGNATADPVVLRSAECAAAAIREGLPPERAFRDLRLPLFVRARMAAAAAPGNSGRFAAALAALAVECRWRRQRLVDDAVRALYPLALVLGAGSAGLLAIGVFSAISGLQGALIP
jgi:type II secretory pathway component PulF